MPSTQSLSNRSLASDPLISGTKGAPRSCPAGSIAEVGLCCVATPSRRRSSQCASGRFREQPGTITPHRLLRRKAEDRILPGPIGRQIGEAGYPHPVRKPPLYSGSD